MFVPSLYKQGAIKNNLFSMYIDSEGQSKITLGGYDEAKYASGPMKFYKITNPTFWSLEFHDVEIGGEAFHTDVTSMMADTGTSLNMIPDKDFFRIMDQHVKSKGMECWVLPNTLTACDCTQE